MVKRWKCWFSFDDQPVSFAIEFEAREDCIVVIARELAYKMGWEFEYMEEL